METTKQKFVLYTNPNNVTNRAYTAIGTHDVKKLLTNANTYPGSYRILTQGKGTNQDIKDVQKAFTEYQF